MTPPIAPDIGKVRLQWLLGDWKSLAELSPSAMEHHADRRALALMVIAGYQQSGKYSQAAQLIPLAREWGCSREEIAEMMIAGVHSALAGAHAATGDAARSMHQYNLSISTAPGGIDSPELAQARAAHQARLTALEVRARQNSQSSGDDSFQRPVNGITSYAQNFEDVMLWRALGTIKGGFYIDVGAQDPVVDSVSKAFYENGWRGIHIEPTQAYADMLRRDRPDEEVIQAAVATASGELVFYEIPETGISTGDPQIALQHTARGFKVQQINVACMSLDHVLENSGNRDIHWLKIDVEGMEKDVLSSWGRSTKRPWIVVVESTLPLTQTLSHEAWEHLLLEKDYQHVYFDGLNKFYLHSEHNRLQPAFECGPNVFDGAVLAGLASATFYRRNQ